MAKISDARTREEEWRAENDLATLLEARKIRQDAKRMERVRELARKRLEGMASVIAETNVKEKSA